jgi:purine-cytosine permease-like protein
LYLIGSVFAPLFAVLLTDYFILKNDTLNIKSILNFKNSLLFVFGVGVYYVLLNIDTPLGTTLPTMLIVAVCCVLVEGGRWLCSKK